MSSSSSHFSQPYAIAVLVRAILYGVYISTFAHCCCQWLLYRNRRQKSQRGFDASDRKLLSITIFIFGFLTMSLGVTIQILLYLLRDDTRSAPLSIFKTIIENIVILITNAVLIYRCWIVYTNSSPWRIIFVPLFLWISALACSIVIGYLHVHMYVTLLHTAGDTLLVLSRQVPGTFPWVVFYVSNIAINIYATCGIIHRITQVALSFSPNSRNLHTTCKILAHFGCLYMITTLLSLISVIPDSGDGRNSTVEDTIGFALDSINLMVPGITFNLVQIFVHWERAKATNVAIMRKSSQTSTNHYPLVHIHQEIEYRSG
ncbi:hypothetical protein M378DRAFT_169021 [Amanita muscaria Koide BX008]|uniref:Uncharacterized protein n=1 Tax=Amanita muscaria (strain Koide BX008) TaxID=946122 RepID=A0A0C2SZQ3_AMAMK|nr:hypothetical protein M378DRAFT_169021 [Amanita muscaria Koide BX008]